MEAYPSGTSPRGAENPQNSSQTKPSIDIENTSPQESKGCSKRWVGIVIVILLLCGLLAIIGSCFADGGVIQPTQTPTSVADAVQYYMDEYDGIPEVYSKILSLTDCAELQEKFDIAYRNSQHEEPGTWRYTITVGYMKASDNRMQEIGCYDE
jgi:hypothetical protein